MAVLAGWAPVWATGSKGSIEKCPVLAGIECLTIFADNDKNRGGSKRRAYAPNGGPVEDEELFGYRAGSDWNDLGQVS